MKWLDIHPNRLYVGMIGIIITRGVKIDYAGPSQISLHHPHPSAASAPHILTKDLQKQQLHDRLIRLPYRPTVHYICSPLGLVPKHNGGWRRIHDLSFPVKHSVNHYIDEAWGQLEYVTFDEAVDAILRIKKGAVLIKRDLADAFRYIPIARSDWWLLRFYWDGSYWMDCFLPFRLRTAPFIFDLFAKGLHWILVAKLGWTIVLHYLDDFFAILSPQADHELYSQQFTLVCSELGLSINNSKNVTSTVTVFLGIEMDSNSMEARLPSDKLARARSLVATHLKNNNISHLELQSLVGFLSFAARVVVPGRAFLRRLFDSLKNYAPYHCITTDMRADLLWWHTFLGH